MKFLDIVKLLLLLAIFCILVIDLNQASMPSDPIGDKIKVEMDAFHKQLDSIAKIQAIAIEKSNERQDSLASIFIQRQKFLEQHYKNLSYEKDQLFKATDSVNLRYYRRYLDEYRNGSGFNTDVDTTGVR